MGYFPNALISDNFNQDNYKDIAAVTADSISVLLGNGDGTFALAVSFHVGNTASSLTSADFNKDGYIDVATGNSGPNSISVLLGNGNGSFKPAINFSVGKSSSPITHSDFNKDGNIDLAVSNNDTISILLGDGTGYFDPAAIHLVQRSQIESLIYADFNQDNEPDLAFANYSTNYGGDSISIVLSKSKKALISGLDSTYCIDSSPIELNAIPAGGNFSGKGIVNSVFTPSTAGIGSDTIIYNVVVDNCKISDTLPVIVEDLPSVNAGEDQTLPNTLTEIQLKATVNNAFQVIWSGGKGTFSPSDTSLSPLYSPTTNELQSGKVELILRASNELCSNQDTVSIVFSSITSNSNIQENMIRAYPNPVSSVLNIEFPEISSQKVLKIYNFLGELIREFYLSPTNKIHIDVSDLKEGMYIFEIQKNKSLYRSVFCRKKS